MVNSLKNINKIAFFISYYNWLIGWLLQQPIKLLEVESITLEIENLKISKIEVHQLPGLEEIDSKK